MNGFNMFIMILCWSHCRAWVCDGWLKDNCVDDSSFMGIFVLVVVVVGGILMAQNLMVHLCPVVVF